MGRDVSIVITAKDNFSTAITTMRNANQAFNKDLSGLQTKLDALNKTKITLKVDVDKAKAALKEAEAQFLKTGDAADKLKLEMANANYENARRNLDLVSKNAKQAEKDILSLTSATSKADNRAVGGTTGILKTLASAGLTQLIGNAISNTADTFVSSTYGSEIGTMFSNILSSAATGAAMGSLAGPPGMAVGAVIGGITGIISGATKSYENRDAAFKQYYQDQYNSALEKQNTALTNGSTIASTREQNRISFATLLGGEENADKYLSEMTEFAARTPFSYDTLSSISKTLLAYGYKQNELLPLLEKVGNAGSALGMSTEDMTYVATALGRMQTSGKTTLEYLNPLLERGIPVWDYLAKASGKTKQEVQEMVSKGLVPGEEAAKAIADYMGADFAGNMEKQAQTYSGLLSTLEDVQDQLNNAMGEGYNEERKKGIQEQINYLSGESGTQMQEAYNQIGQWKASLENLAEQFQRDALNAVMTGSISAEFSPENQARLKEMYDEYTKYASDDSEEAGAKMGQLLAEAQAIAQNEYNASDGAQLALQSNKTLANNIKDDAGIQEAYWDAGYSLGQQFTKGLSSAILDADKNKITEDGRHYLTGEYGSGSSGSYPANIYKGGGNYAYGISYVPYDNFPALLHEGERVLTASENRAKDKSVTPTITISGNNFVIRSNADVVAIGKEICRQIAKAFDLS